MTKEMIISSNDHETRVAILEDDLVAELFVERERQRGVVGNIYKGRVSKGAARHAVGLRRHRPRARRVPLRLGRRPGPRDDGRCDESERATERRAEAPRSAAKGDSRGGRGQKAEDRDRAEDREPAPQGGQDILVQVVKEPLGTKGARLTSHASLAGRFLVFMPTVDHVGVSRKIESREERSRLRGHRARVPRAARTSPAASSSAPPPPAARRKTSSATSSTSTRSGRKRGRRWTRCARRSSSTASRASSPSCCATC